MTRRSPGVRNGLPFVLLDSDVVCNALGACGYQLVFSSSVTAPDASSTR